MKRALKLAFLPFALAAMAFVPAHAAQGTIVAATDSDCSDYFLVKTDDSYALLEWFAGASANKGDDVTGTFDHYGTQMIAVLPHKDMMRAWLEDYDLSEDDAQEKLMAKCS